MRARACGCVITHACGHLWMSVGTRVGMSVSSERSGRCMRLGVTAVTQELQWAERQRRGWGAGRGGLLLEEGSCLRRTVWSERQARGSTGGARTRASIRGASSVCALGACRRQEPPADLPPYLPADSLVGCGFLRAQRPWEDVSGSLGALGPLSAAPGSGKGLRPRCSPAAVLPGRIRALPTPAVPPGALRAARAATGEGKGPQSGVSTPAGAPHPADSGRREPTARLGPGGRGCFPEGPEGPEPVRGQDKGPGLGRPGIFRGRGRGRSHHPHTR